MAAMFPRLTRWLLIAVATVVSTPCGQAASGTPRESSVLTNVIQLRSLTTAEAARGHPVTLRGVVTYAHTGEDGQYALFVQDATAGVFVFDPQPDPGACRPGQSVEVVGESDPGLYAPVIRKQRLRVLGEGEMPPAKLVTVDELLTGRLDGQRVRLRGTVTRVESGSRTVKLGLLAGASRIEAVVAMGPGQRASEGWRDAEVEAVGVCAAVFNGRRQLSGIALFVAGPAGVEVLRAAPADPFDAPLRTIAGLRQFEPQDGIRNRVRVTGVVTLHLSNEGVFVQDESDGLFIPAREVGPFEVGDRVEAVGYLQTRAPETVLLEPRFRRLSRGMEPSAVAVAGLPARLEGCENRLVSLEAKLLESWAVAPGSLRCRVGLIEFEVVGADPGSRGAFAALEPGMRLGLTGVWVVRREGLPGGSSARLVLRTASDLRVLERPSRWTPQRTLALVSGLLVVALGALFWVVVLRRQLALRTAQTQEALALLEASIEESPSGIVIVDAPSLVVRRMNAAALAMRGTDREPLTALGLGTRSDRWKAFRPGGEAYAPDQMPLVRAVRKGEVTQGEEVLIRSADGRDRWVAINAAPVRAPDGRVVAGILVFHDITDRKTSEEERSQLQAQLLQAQKMESVGRLAGGVAHDFNNMLQTILGNADLALSDAAVPEATRESLMEIRNAASRSADLVRQLLAFARKQAVNPRVLDPNNAVVGTLKMLRRLLGEDIRLVWQPGQPIWPIRMDPSQLDQVIANLVVNSRDAIRGNGGITISTANRVVDEAMARSVAELVPGDYVCLEVSDSGVGMSEGVLKHLFEPFFTTKEVGRGTGLGLATVYGIMRQNGGAIGVTSQLGVGSTFTLFFPRAHGTPEPTEAPVSASPAGGQGTVLLVEDEEVVLSYCRRVLQQHGYEVLAVGSPRTAIELVQQRQGPLDLLVTDVVMPEMNGQELWERLREIRPGLRCLFMSGYTADAVSPDGSLSGGGIEFLQKPFTMEVFVRRIGEMIDSTTVA